MMNKQEYGIKVERNQWELTFFFTPMYGRSHPNLPVS